MAIELPDPSEDSDVWGTELNSAIEAIDSKADAAAAAAATNVSASDDDDGNVAITYGENSATLLKTSAVGAPSGVASLDAAGQVPLDQLGNLSASDVGAASAFHQHSLNDVPQVALAVNQAPAIAIFNTATQKWPALTAVTDSPTRPIIWTGDADIPTYARPNVDFFFGPRKSGTTVVTPTPPDEPTTAFDANGVSLGLPVVTVNGSTYNITANVETNSNVTFAYLQLAVRGPQGEAQDTGYNNNEVVNSTIFEVDGSGNAASTGTWTVRLAYNLTGGSAQTNWVDGPTAEFTIVDLGGVPSDPGTGTPGSGTMPVLGRSGLSWNSGVLTGGNGSVTSANEFFNWRNRPGDSIMYFTGRATWTDLTWLRDDLTAWPGYRVIALPSQPTGQSNAATAAGTNNAFWIQYGLNLKNKGWDDGRTIMRLNWEANGNWYSWAWQNGGPAQFVQAYKNVVNSVKVHAPKTKFIMNMNRGNNYDGTVWQTQIMDPLIGFVDIVGLDSYDHAPAQTNDSSWNSTLAQNPGLTSVATYCRAKGVKMSLDEWGPSYGVSGSFTGGGDNPYYMAKMWDWINANDDVLALETEYNHVGAPSSLKHQIFPTTINPNAAAAYKSTSRWGRA